MTILALIASSSPLAALPRLWGTFKAWRQARAAYADQCALDDHALADIGISRSDLRSASAQGLADNPTAVLSEAVKERRTGRNDTRKLARQQWSLSTDTGRGAARFGRAH